MKCEMQRFSEDTAVVGCAKGAGVRVQGAGEGNISVRSYSRASTNLKVASSMSGCSSLHVTCDG